MDITSKDLREMKSLSVSFPSCANMNEIAAEACQLFTEIFRPVVNVLI